MIINKSKRRLKPWVKNTLVFVVGAMIVASVYTVFQASAKTEGVVNSDNDIKAIHGVIEINLNGESHVKPIDGETGGEIVISQKKNYIPMQIVTILYDNGDIINHYVTEDNELKNLMKKHDNKITEYRQGVLKAEYE
ncbi:hypothetical protein P8891_05685 [Bacillus atrophaeus]|uniref:hypothetical protein n=1 Tax=Bacillus atrophaeus TaxID=1452 RepID=UPI0022805D49|nr:hypothetical protein [Bacillus atrophaeus]MCY7947952.1 hypothetical protein [Bacillus atrophaeus]MCY8098249.1 hypothetical protein [Bacillus atrophaeus]MCY9170026.1 hypothetical protein [Bacillus atrophaeus]MEC0740579.1 hypothetical protein [Bacillus atrophaeus]MEC0746985.1 hypothetical protein [Bacillus atrophaeus]